MENAEKLEIIKTAVEYLDKLIEGINATVELYQGGNEGKANDNMIDIIDGLQWLITAIGATSDIQKERVQLNEINEHLSEIISAFENTDYVLLGDLLEYEISPVIKNWKNILLITIEA